MRKQYYGAIAVLENFLDGAIADWENGAVTNKFLIKNCIEAIITLNPIQEIDYREVLDRLEKEEKQ